MAAGDVETSDLRVCQCCLSTDVDDFSSFGIYGPDFEILSGEKLEKTELRLCHECRHGIRKLSRFRAMCYGAQEILREFYANHPEKRVNLDFLTQKREQLNLGAKLSQSNTLSVSVFPQNFVSPTSVQISSTSHGAKPSKNFTQDMLEEMELKDGNQIEIKEEPLNVVHDIELEVGKEQNNTCTLSNNLNVEQEMELEVGKEQNNTRTLSKHLNVEHEIEHAMELEVGIEQNNTFSEYFGDDGNHFDDFESSKLVTSVKSVVEKEIKTKLKKNAAAKKTKKSIDVNKCILQSEEESQIQGVNRGGEETLASMRPETPGSLSCPVCRQSFCTQKEVIQHLQQHVGESNCCSDCGKFFKRAKALVKHAFLVHGAGDSFCCEKCAKNYSSKSLLESHIRRHEAASARSAPPPPPLPVHYCVECDRHYKSAYILRQHFRRTTRHRDPNVYRFECSLCPSLRRFRSSALLSQHARAVHERVEQLTCHRCGGNYATLDSLQSHVKKKHLGYKPPRKWACTYCDKKFRAQNVLQNHIRIHTGEKPFACPVCHDRFRQKAALDTHVRAVHLKLGVRRRRPPNTDKGCVVEGKGVEQKQEV